MRNVSVLGSTAIALALAATVTTPALAQDFNMKIAHVVPKGDPRDTAARHVADLMNESDSCSMSAEVFPSAQLGSTTDLIEGMQFGSIEAVVLPASFLVGFQPMMGVFDLPYFWPSDVDALTRLHNGDAVRKLLDSTDAQGVYSMAAWHTGNKQWTGNKPLVDPKDYQGLNSRVMPSAVLVAQQSALGLNPVDMPFPETYSALQSGAIDAQENPVPTSYFMKFNEVQSHMTMTNHGNLDQIFMVSKSWWEGLTPECQTALDAAVTSGQEVVISETQRIEKLAMEAFKEQGMTIVTPTDEQRATLRDGALPAARAKFIEQTGEAGEAMLKELEAAMENL